MDQRLTESRFRTTSWSLIARAPGNREDLEALLGRYWSPVYAYLRRKGRSESDALDLTQGFLTDVVLGRELVERADAARGKFRTLLLTALDRYVIDCARRERGRDGHRPRILVPDDPEVLRAADPREEDDPARAFDRQWATTVLNRALHCVEDECRGGSKTRHWMAFEARIVRPAVHGAEPEAMDSVLARCDETEPQVVYSMIQTVKRKLAAAVREVIAETVERPDDIEEEINALRGFLSVPTP